MNVTLVHFLVLPHVSSFLVHFLVFRNEEIGLVFLSTGWSWATGPLIPSLRLPKQSTWLGLDDLGRGNSCWLSPLKDIRCAITSLPALNLISCWICLRLGYPRTWRLIVVSYDLPYSNGHILGLNPDSNSWVSGNETKVDVATHDSPHWWDWSYNYNCWFNPPPLVACCLLMLVVLGQQVFLYVRLRSCGCETQPN